MSGIGCCFWWFLFGALLGWLASWLLGRLLAKSEEVEPLRAAAPVKPSDGIDYAAARAAGYLVSGPDNLEIIEGIGPSIARLLRSNGVDNFSRLANTSVTALQTILQKGGTRFSLANPATWPEQAALAATNRWPELRALQDALDAGIRHD